MKVANIHQKKHDMTTSLPAPHIFFDEGGQHSSKKSDIQNACWNKTMSPDFCDESRRLSSQLKNFLLHCLRWFFLQNIGR